MSSQDSGGTESRSPPHAAAATEWLRRVEAEYTSAAITAQFVQWLIRLGAPPELIRDGLRIVDDELEHATLSHITASAAGSQARPKLVQEQLGIARVHPTLLDDAIVTAVEVFCLGETVAVPLFVAMRATCTIAEPRAALDRIVRDEVRHRDFGWACLDWLMQTAGPQVSQLLDVELPKMMARVRRNYCAPGGDDDGANETGAADRNVPSVTDPNRGDAAAAWGLLPVDRYAEILERCVLRDYMPRFEALGLNPALCRPPAHSSHSTVQA